jgi:hypothetical protein
MKIQAELDPAGGLLAVSARRLEGILFAGALIAGKRGATRLCRWLGASLQTSSGLSGTGASATMLRSVVNVSVAACDGGF